MSYILDALRKSEQERTAGSSPEAVAPTAIQPGARRPPVAAALVVGVVLAGLLAWRYLTDATPEASKQTADNVSSPGQDDNRYDLADALPAPKPVAAMPHPKPPAVATPAATQASGYVPYLREMPDDFQQQLPRLAVDIHVFIPGGRSVLYINGREYGAGETIANGLRVEGIVQEGAVLSYQGSRFRLPRPNR